MKEFGTVQVGEAFQSLQRSLRRWEAEKDSESAHALQAAITQAREVTRQERARGTWLPPAVEQLDQQAQFAEECMTLQAQERARKG